MMWQLREYSVPMSPWIPHLGLQVSQVASVPPPPPASSATSSGPPGLSAKAPAPRLPFLAQVQSDIKAWEKASVLLLFLGFDFGASQL